MQAGSITNNLKVKMDFTLPELSARRILTWNFHLDESAKSRYDMILGRYLLTDLILNLNFSDIFIKADGETLRGSSNPMVYLGMYVFKYR